MSVRPCFLEPVWCPLAFLSILVLALGTARGATISVDPGPGNQRYASTRYRVEIFDGNGWIETYTYSFERPSLMWHWRRKKSYAAHWASFSVAPGASHQVRVTALNGTLPQLRISPKRKGISAKHNGQQATFTLRCSDQVWISFEHDPGNELFLFCNPPPPAVPPGATEFAAGVHDIGQMYPVASGQTIYLHAGAWVRGNFDLTRAEGAQILGPGILSGDQWVYDQNIGHFMSWEEMRRHFMILAGTTGKPSLVQGITIVNAPSYHSFGCLSFDHVKLLSPWVGSTDGFYTEPTPEHAVYAKNCFAFVGDDVFFPRYSFKGNIQVSDCFVGSTNNSIFNVGYWGSSLEHDFYFLAQRIDIKTYNERGIWQATLDSTGPDRGYENMIFEDIYIEGSLRGPLLNLANAPYPWKINANPELGRLQNLVFRRVTLEGRQRGKSILKGKNQENGLFDLRFEDLSINGTRINARNFRQHFDVNRFVNGLEFATTQDPP